MARKGLLSKSLDRTLSGDTAKPDAIERSAPSPAPEAVKARSGNPTVKRFKETFDELRGEAMQEIDTALIGSSRYKDRFDASSEIQGLAASIQEAGQQIPVLLRVTSLASRLRPTSPIWMTSRSSWPKGLRTLSASRTASLRKLTSSSN